MIFAFVRAQATSVYKTTHWRLWERNRDCGFASWVAMGSYKLPCQFVDICSLHARKQQMATNQRPTAWGRSANRACLLLGRTVASASNPSLSRVSLLASKATLSWESTLADPVVSLQRQIANASRAADRAMARGDQLTAARQFERMRTLAAYERTENPQSDEGAALRLKEAAAHLGNSLHPLAAPLARAIRRPRLRVLRGRFTTSDLIELRALMVEAERCAAQEAADPELWHQDQRFAEPPLEACAWNLETALAWLARPKVVA